MFVDQVKIHVKAGDGGNGCASFRREPYVPKGGPNGGNGGNGGDVLLRAVAHQNTLLPLRYHREFRAKRGGHGGSGNKTGRSAPPLEIAVPPGTIATDIETEARLGEVLEAGESLPLARGGSGGRGNYAFLSNRNRAPREAEPGKPGEERWIRLDLKLLADVGLLGLPNAGKSTLLSRLSSARPKIADYPFTTLTPVLGVVEEGEKDFVMADIPGILEGAHKGVGLGLQFLRHVERTRTLVYVVDASGTSGRDPVADLDAVRREVASWNTDLLDRPQLVAATKRDALAAEDPLPRLQRSAKGLGLSVVAISAVTGAGLGQLKRALLRLLEAGEAIEEAHQ